MKTNVLTMISAALILAISMIVVAGNALAETYLKLGDIEGEANDNEHDDWIEIASVTHQVNRDPKTGKLTRSTKIKRAVDSSSPALVKAFLDGTVFSQMTVERIDESGDVTESKTSRNLMASSYSTSIEGGVLMEELTLIADIWGSQHQRKAYDLNPND